MKFNVCYVQLTLAAPQSVKAPSWVWSSHIQKVCGSLKGWKYSVDFEGVEVILKPDWRIWKTGMVLIASWRNFATIEHTADASFVAFWPFRGRKNFQHNKNFKHKITFFYKISNFKKFCKFWPWYSCKIYSYKKKKSLSDENVQARRWKPLRHWSVQQVVPVTSCSRLPNEGKIETMR